MRWTKNGLRRLNNNFMKKEEKQLLIACIIMVLFFMWVLRDKSPAKNIDHNYRQCNSGLCEYGSYDEMMGGSEW